MLRLILPWRRRAAQVSPAPAPDTHAPHLAADDHAERAAWHLYESVRPADGLPWWHLTDRQRTRYRGLVRLAQRCSDATAIRAAHEAVSKLLANHEDESLESIPPVLRTNYRQRGLAACLLFERVLTTGTPESDSKILDLVAQEALYRHGRRQSS